jgi:DNA repair protein RadC
MYHIPAYTVALVREGTVDTQSYPTVRSPEAIYHAFKAHLKDSGVEQFAVGLLNIRHRIIGMYTVSVGVLTSSLVHPREVFGPAVVHKAAAVVLGHNHPSGEPEPSAEDIAITRRLVSAGQLLGIDVLDHVVLGDGQNRFVSLKERGVL